MIPVSGGRLYDTQHWKRLRRMVLAKHPICTTIGCDKPATDVDHIDGDNTNLTMDNDQGLCKSCHSKKTRAQSRGGGIKSL